MLILTFSPARSAASSPASTLRKVAAARNRPELVGVERIQRDIDPLDAASGQFIGEAGEL